MTKTIQLTQGKVALVDDADYEWLNAHKWYYAYGYAVRAIWWLGNKTVWMHREIIGTPEGLRTDHINGDGLDNRRVNLRVCTPSENACNRGAPSNNISGFKGVSWDKRYAKWRAAIQVNGRKKHVGYFDTIEEAIRAYDRECINLHGKFARTNKESA